MAKTPRPAKAGTARARREREDRPARHRGLWIGLSLAGVLALQVWTCRDRFAAPFLDTRLHYDHDNARFSFSARSGNRNGDLRSQLGVTMNAYSRWGERSAEPTYYTDHPFLVKALFQQYTRLVGTPEWASRGFYLAVSFLIAAGLYTILLRTTGSLAGALAGAATLVSLPLFAVYQTSVKFEADGMLVSVWAFVALAAYLGRGTRRPLAVYLYGTLVALAFLAHWTAVIFVGVLAACLAVGYRRGRDPAWRRALGVTAGSAAAGALLLLASLAYLQRGWGNAWAALAASFSRRSAAIPAAAWWERQQVYAKQNFTDALPWILAAIGAIFAVRWWRSRPVAKAAFSEDGGRLLGIFVVVTLTVACVWLLAFRQGSFVHVYWQYWLCLPAAAIVGAFVGAFRSRALALAAASLACGGLVLYLLAASRAAWADVRVDQLGTAEDVAFLSSLRDDRFGRLVFVPVTDAPLNAWFQGPLFEYYTDRSVAIAAGPGDLHPGDKALVLRYQQRQQVADGLADWSRRRLANEKCGARLCAYDVADP